MSDKRCVAGCVKRTVSPTFKETSCARPAMASSGKAMETYSGDVGAAGISDPSAHPRPFAAGQVSRREAKLKPCAVTNG